VELQAGQGQWIGRYIAKVGIAEQHVNSGSRIEGSLDNGTISQ
jgi:hypothetical protein